ncbi:MULTISPECIES: diguanylate cyclase domain-containing protein [Paraburkholderia]|uniref:Diguanylate cyclase n=1 Tax=Paraburkholderia madseniana TaxID=2599607 RepID=A0AAP5ER93_9BURK|nr:MULTISPECIES: diguanylate cyclase [Paraburkholderia]MCX4150030.1 diguanylate cyclase [Paraburkholderia madseniana]MCX4175679.1 diguanylate cyclase [Paraburkholderia madseniana]MDN7152966.1 diguanylate cyclase [Paraburkholderia sp. WS6]MDQ6411848.1 diguanylate cyclase [Paraburkholderia madseniana]MDQ6463674.1 diguanylate cyclase [Paraburkholderia madseniana]
MKDLHDGAVLYSHLGTSSPVWKLTRESDDLSLCNTAGDPVVAIELDGTQAEQIRNLTGVTSAIVLDAHAFGRQMRLHLIGKKSHVSEWAGSAAAFCDAEAVSQNLSRALAFAEQVVSEVNSAVVIIDQNGIIQRFNRRAEEYTGMSEASVIGLSAHQLFMSAPESAASQGNIANFFNSGRPYEVERTINTASGPRLFFFRNNFTLNPAWTSERFLICSGIDITDERRATARLTAIANTDPLTNLPNRYFLTETLKTEIQKSGPRDRVSILFIDIDNFKLINDQLGHQVGDELLSKVANRLRGVLVSGEQLIRVGGDEFVVLITDDSREARAIDAARRIIEELNVVFVLHGRSYSVHVSIGIASMSATDESEFEILRRADLAMYTAKATGKAAGASHYCVHTPELSGRADRHIEQVQAFQQALLQRELHMEFVPIFSMRTTAPVGFHTSLTWRRGDEIVLTASEIMPLAERSGLSVHVSEFMVQSACRYLGEYPATGAQLPYVSLAVSTAQLAELDMAGSLAECLTRHGIAPDRIRLKIGPLTDSNQEGEIVKKIKAIRSGGSPVFLDITDAARFADFTAGLIDGVCFGSGLIARVPFDRPTCAVLKGVIGTCEELELGIMIHGVDNSSQLRWLKQFPTLDLEGAILPSGFAPQTPDPK